jgi:hypothetical protein
VPRAPLKPQSTDYGRKISSARSSPRRKRRKSPRENFLAADRTPARTRHVYSLPPSWGHLTHNAVTTYRSTISTGTMEMPNALSVADLLAASIKVTRSVYPQTDLALATRNLWGPDRRARPRHSTSLTPIATPGSSLTPGPSPRDHRRERVTLPDLPTVHAQATCPRFPGQRRQVTSVIGAGSGRLLDDQNGISSVGVYLLHAGWGGSRNDRARPRGDGDVADG